MQNLIELVDARLMREAIAELDPFQNHEAASSLLDAVKNHGMTFEASTENVHGDLCELIMDAVMRGGRNVHNRYLPEVCALCRTTSLSSKAISSTCRVDSSSGFSGYLALQVE